MIANKPRSSIHVRRINAMIQNALEVSKAEIPEGANADDYIDGIETAIWGAVALVSSQIIHGHMTAADCYSAYEEYASGIEREIAEADECDE